MVPPGGYFAPLRSTRLQICYHLGTGEGSMVRGAAVGGGLRWLRRGTPLTPWRSP